MGARRSPTKRGRFAEFSPTELAFLQVHEVPLIWIFDARAWHGDFTTQMASEGRLFSHGGPACRFGHTLRTRSGSCIQCSPENIKIAANVRKNGHVFIAKSKELSLLHVGTAYLEGYDDWAYELARPGALNARNFAGVDDWGILAESLAYYAGSLEMRLHKALEPYSRTVDHLSGLSVIEAHGLYRCSYDKAALAFWSLLDGGAQDRALFFSRPLTE